MVTSARLLCKMPFLSIPLLAVIANGIGHTHRLTQEAVIMHKEICHLSRSGRVRPWKWHWRSNARLSHVPSAHVPPKSSSLYVQNKGGFAADAHSSSQRRSFGFRPQHLGSTDSNATNCWANFTDDPRTVFREDRVGGQSHVTVQQTSGGLRAPIGEHGRTLITAYTLNQYSLISKNTKLTHTRMFFSPFSPNMR